MTHNIWLDATAKTGQQLPQNTQIDVWCTHEQSAGFESYVLEIEHFLYEIYIYNKNIATGKSERKMKFGWFKFPFDVLV